MLTSAVRLTRNSLSTSLKRVALLRGDVEQALAADVRSLLERVTEYSAASVRAGRSGAAATEVPLSLLADLRKQFLEITRTWPRRAWDQVRVSLREDHANETNRKFLNDLLDEICWPLDGRPFTLNAVDRKRLIDALQRNADRRMQGTSEVWAAVSRQLEQRLALDEVTILNAAARARQEAGFLIDEFIKAGIARQTVDQPDTSGRLPGRPLTHRESASSGGKRRAEKTRYPEIRKEVERRLAARGNRRWHHGDISAFINDVLDDVKEITRPETIREWIATWRKENTEL